MKRRFLIFFLLITLKIFTAITTIKNIKIGSNGKPNITQKYKCFTKADKNHPSLVGLLTEENGTVVNCENGIAVKIS